MVAAHAHQPPLSALAAPHAHALGLRSIRKATVLMRTSSLEREGAREREEDRGRERKGEERREREREREREEDRGRERKGEVWRERERAGERERARERERSTCCDPRKVELEPARRTHPVSSEQ
eukprot:3445762-Rhodomonas_salina.2